MKQLLFPRMAWRSAVAALALCGASVSLTQAAEVSGVVLPDGTKVGDQSLVLNGAGMRALAVFRVYVIGMYLPHRASSPAEVLDMPGAKRLQLVLMRDVDGEDFGRVLGKGMADNLSAQEMAVLQSRVDQLKQAMALRGEASKGSQVILDYAPESGTHITINGTALGNDIPGEDFYKGLLKVWLGPRPAGDYLKRELLGQTG